MFWLIEKIILVFGSIALSSFLLGAYTYWIVPIMAMFAVCYLAIFKIKNRLAKILIVLLPGLYFVGGVIISIFLMLWMLTPF